MHHVEGTSTCCILHCGGFQRCHPLRIQHTRDNPPPSLFEPTICIPDKLLPWHFNSPVILSSLVFVNLHASQAEGVLMLYTVNKLKTMAGSNA